MPLSCAQKRQRSAHTHRSDPSLLISYALVLLILMSFTIHHLSILPTFIDDLPACRHRPTPSPSFFDISYSFRIHTHLSPQIPIRYDLVVRDPDLDVYKLTHSTCSV